MTTSKGKTTTIAAALLIILAMAISLIAAPADNKYATAQDTKKSFCYLGVTPNPVGVNQEVLLHIGSTEQLQQEADGYEDLWITIERPDGETETIEDIRTDSTGGTGRNYVPTMEGTYKLQGHFPAQWYNYSDYWGGVIATWYTASESDVVELVVQADPIEYYPGNALPTEFWTRPINAQLREWSVVSGSSYMDQEYNEAPESPHVLWTKVMTIGGLAGGDLGVHSMEHGDAYEGKWPNRLILAGRLYYETGPYDRPKYIYCVDVRTGEQLWTKVFYDNLSIAQGQMLYFDSFNYHGVFSYLWFTSGTTWYAHNPLTGEWVYTMTNVPSGTNQIGPSGEILRYTVSTSGGYLRVWNSTRAGMQNATGMQAGSWGSRVSLQTINVTYYGWEKEITIPTGYPGSVRAVGLGDRIIGANEGDYAIDIWGINLNESEGDVGEELFSVTWDFDDAWLDANVSFVRYGSGWSVTDLDSKIGLVWAKELRQYYAFSLDTGSLMWIQEVPQVSYLDNFGIGARIEYGRVYTVGMAGNLHCFNATNGKLLWIYNATDYYSENLWGNNWNVDIDFISGEKIYLFHSEHSPVNPLFRDAPALCINATTGEEIWRANGLLRTTDWGGSAIMGDSVITMYNSYDQRIWAIGKGPSATAVSAAPKVSVEGDMVIVEGMVTDVSPATNDDAVAMRFPNGVPAVSDESQGEWMKYVYAQFARPTDATGVEVIISVLDPNNNAYEVARTTSDASGFFSAEFIPEVPGKYTVTATFEGSGAYYGSFAETAIRVEETPQASPTPTPSPAPLTDMYVTGFGIGMIIAIVVVGLLLFLMLRKR